MKIPALKKSSKEFNFDSSEHPGSYIPGDDFFEDFGEHADTVKASMEANAEAEELNFSSPLERKSYTELLTNYKMGKFDLDTPDGEFDTVGQALGMEGDYSQKESSYSVKDLEEDLKEEVDEEKTSFFPEEAQSIIEEKLESIDNLLD